MVSLSEQLLTLSAAARGLPGPSGRGLHTSTIWRWSQRGVKGVRLETVLVGGVRYTSREALDRFVAATTAAADGTSSPIRTSRQRERSIAAAEKELAGGGL